MFSFPKSHVPPSSSFDALKPPHLGNGISFVKGVFLAGGESRVKLKCRKNWKNNKTTLVPTPLSDLL